jgi:hypothetical protein
MYNTTHILEKKMKYTLTAIILLICFTTIYADKSSIDNYLATWLTANKQAHVKLQKSGSSGTYVGEIVWQSDKALEKNNVVGQNMITGLQYDSESGTLINGKIEMNGRKLDCTLELENSTTLKVTFSTGAIKRSVKWTKVN